MKSTRKNSKFYFIVELKAYTKTGDLVQESVVETGYCNVIRSASVYNRERKQPLDPADDPVKEVNYYQLNVKYWPVGENPKTGTPCFELGTIIQKGEMK